MSAPRFSITICNYNYGRFLRQAIDSCLAQTYPAHEIIVYDDGSTDESREILKEYEGRPALRIVYQENRGQVATLQRGYEEATGDWVLGMDSDDYYFPDCLAEFARHAGEGVSWIYSRAQRIDRDGKPVGLRPDQKIKLIEGNLPEQWQRPREQFAFPPQTFACYPKTFLKTIHLPSSPGVDMAGGMCPDSYMPVAAAFWGRVVAIDRPLGVYREHQTGFTGGLRKSFSGWQIVFRSILRKDELLTTRLKEHGYVPPLPPSYHYWLDFWELRLLSVSFDPLNHVYPNERRIPVAWRAAVLLWSDNKLRREEKIFRHLKLWLMLLFPSRAWDIFQWRPRRDLKVALGRFQKNQARECFPSSGNPCDR